MEHERTAPMDDGAETVRDRLRAALREAMKARDSVAVRALRSALGTLDNAEAVDAERAPQPTAGHPRLAGTVSGLRAAEVERRNLSASQMDELVHANVAERLAVADDYEHAGQRAHAEQLRHEATVISACLGGGATS